MNHLSPSSIELRTVRGILRYYCQALTASDVQIGSTEELSQRGIGWTSVESPTTEGTTVFLPPIIEDAETATANFETYKIFATHQAGHLEFGTFRFDFGREAIVFKNDFRLVLEQLKASTEEALTDFERFLDCFRDRRLATDIFTVVEDGRVDFHLKREYNGIRRLYHRAQEESLTKRPLLVTLPLKEVLLEVLVQISMGQQGEIAVPERLVSDLLMAASILRRAHLPSSTVEDAAEATIRLYYLLQMVPNVASSTLPPEAWSIYDLSGGMEIDDEALEEMLYRFFLAGELGRETEGFPYSSPRSVRFRGELKPELAQTLMKLSMRRNEGERGPSSPKQMYEALKQLFDKSVEIDKADRANLSPASFATNLLKERGKAYLDGDLPRREQRQPAAKRSKVKTSSLPEDFLYDEWDFMANHYKPDWCRLRQKVLEEGGDQYFAETLAQYTGLVTKVKREFEHLKTERFKKIKGLHDGDDIDFDAVVDALVERRAGAPFSDRVYWRRKKLERDVCVSFLLDMSASTYEKISEGVWAPTDSVAHARMHSAKRIIDLEKESIIVLIQALEAIGDDYGIYGFSGHGRDHVEFAIIKDIAEDCSPAVKRRIANVNPIQGTRMGPAIRHLSAILNRQEAKTKLLILISDGRPQDYDYGSHHAGEEWGLFNHLPNRHQLIMDEATERMKREYAIYDTRMALLEAQQKGIVPFCLTIDRTGHDYLRVMCGEVGYEVLDDIYALPRRLPTLYRRLTAHV